MSRTITVHYEGTPCYDITLQRDFSLLADKIIALGYKKEQKLCVITDSNVAALYLDEVMTELQKCSDTVISHVFPAGEEHKNVATIETIYETLIQAKFEDMTLLGYTSRFSQTYGLTEELAMSHVEIGSGVNPESKLEGIRSGRVIATYLLGPLLVANPDFALWLLKQLGAEVDKLPHEDALRAAYDFKLKEFQRPDLALD